MAVYAGATGTRARIVGLVVGCALAASGCYVSNEDTTVHERQDVESAFLRAGLPVGEPRKRDEPCVETAPIVVDRPDLGLTCPIVVKLERPSGAPAPTATLAPRRREPFSVSIYETAADAEQAIEALTAGRLPGELAEYVRSGNVVAAVVRRDRALLDDVEAVLDDL